MGLLNYFLKHIRRITYGPVTYGSAYGPTTQVTVTTSKSRSSTSSSTTTAYDDGYGDDGYGYGTVCQECNGLLSPYAEFCPQCGIELKIARKYF